MDDSHAASSFLGLAMALAVVGWMVMGLSWMEPASPPQAHYQPPAGAAARVAAKPAEPVREVAHWMVGRFFGVNGGPEGNYVQLDITRNGHVIASVNRAMVHVGRIEGDRLSLENRVYLVTQTAEGLRTQEIGREKNVVYYVRR